MSNIKNKKTDTIIVNAGRNPQDYHGVVNPPVYRCSTVTYKTIKQMAHTYENKYDMMFYGRFGTPTTFALEEAVAKLEGGYRSIAVSSGLAAITLTLLALLKSGDHLLMTDSTYGPTREFCEGTLKRFGIEVSYYNPLLGDKIENLIKENTRLIYCESPGSLTFEVQDIPSICNVAKKHNIAVAADNTWATPLYAAPFEKGIDISIQAGTKYIVGHSDAMLGMITTNEKYYEKLKDFVTSSGVSVGSEEAYLGLRGLRTMSARLKQHQLNTVKVIEFIKQRKEIKKIYSPILENDEGHKIWKRDFTGYCSLFGIELDPIYTQEDVNKFLEDLELFAMGYSWGGYESLIIPVRHIERDAKPFKTNGQYLRLHVGLEDPEDLIQDLEKSLKILTGNS